MKKGVIAVYSLCALGLIAHNNAVADCYTSSGKWAEQRPSSCLQDPGWFDVGAGIVVIKNAGIAQQNGVGNMVSLRAYPFGRWYAPLKAQAPEKQDAVASKVDMASAKNKVAANSRKNAAQQLANAASQAKGVAALSTSAVVSNAENAAANSTLSAGELITFAEKLVKEVASNASASASIKQAAADAKNAADQAAIDQSAADMANTEVAQGMQSALDAFGHNFSLEELNAFQNFGRRISFFLGRSIGGFDKSVVDGDINAFGIAIDVSPEFALVWGRAYFNQPIQTGVANNTRSGMVLGVQLNLKAFKAMRGLTGSL